MSLFTITFDESSESGPPAPLTPSPSPPARAPVPAAPNLPSESEEYSSYSEEIVPTLSPTIAAAAPPSSRAAPSPSELEDDIEDDFEEQIRVLRRRIPAHASSNLVVSKVFRDQKRGIAKHAKFVLMRTENAVLCTKIKDKKFIPIGIGAAFHYRATASIGCVRCSDKSKAFLVVGPDGKELMRMVFGIQEDLGKHGPRTVTLTFLEPIEGIPIELRSRLARKSPAGGWILDLIGKYAQPSVKNCVIVNEANDVFLVTRKSATNAVMVDSHPAIPDLYIFAFALAQFLAHV
jgi:hypothetical protein